MEERPNVIVGRTVRARTGCGNLYITLNESDGKLFEVFTQMGHSGGCAAAQSQAESLTLSIALRSGADPFELMTRLVGIRCDHEGEGTNGILGCPDALGRAIGYWMGYYDENLQPIAGKELKMCNICQKQSGYFYECCECGKFVCLRCSPRGFTNRELCRYCVETEQKKG